MSSPIIRVENLGKCYRIHHETRERYTALRDVIARKAAGLFGKLKSGKQKAEIQNAGGHDPSLLSQFPISAFPAAPAAEEDFWALKDVSFEVNQGEVVGIIGRNGAGKSTLLKILSRITEPTKGRITLNGRVASLLEVGTGFHPELTGRENIFLNGAILGMSRVEIKSKFDEIVAFAEVERFLDTPVKRYSSGMYVRLAFAVAAHLEPEILVVDEVLAVGDAQFQEKCLGKMNEVAKKGGRTILFVSHNMTAVASLCSRAVYLAGGKVNAIGTSSEMIDAYLGSQVSSSAFSPRHDHRSGDRRVMIDDFSISPGQLQTGQRATFEFHVSTGPHWISGAEAEFAIGVSTVAGGKTMMLFSADAQPAFELPQGKSIVRVVIDQIPLVPGTYALNLWAGLGTVPYDWIRDCFRLIVSPGGFAPGRIVGDHGYPVVVASTWELSHI
jgi:lipopolysaccharide transport system ATP-binding protein